MHRRTRAAVRLMLLGTMTAAAACASDAPEPANRTGTTVDSAIPRDEALRRFQEGVEPVATLAGPASRDSLVAEFVRAVAARDTLTLRSLMLDRAEFAHLFYPATSQGLPPYEVSPQLMWDLLVRQSDRGVRDALSRLGGKQLDLVGYDCASEPGREGGNLIWPPCTLTLATNTDTLAGRMTGPIIERDGRYKFVSYTNDLD